MNKLIILALSQLAVGTAVVVVFLFLNQSNNQILTGQLLNHQQAYQDNKKELKTLKQQLKINEINLVSNIDSVKNFIKMHTNRLSLNKVKKTNRGMEYLLIGQSIDVLVLLHKVTKEQLKIDVTRLLFKTQDKLVAEITVIGVEQ